MNKVCKRCLHKRRHYEKTKYCTVCTYELNREKHKTKEGLIEMMYCSQKQSSKKRGHSPPAYTIEQLKEWCFEQEIFEEMYDAWVDSGFNKWKIPTVDRIDPRVGYAFGNIQLLTLSENIEKGKIERSLGLHETASKEVAMLSKDGTIIKIYRTATAASRATGVNLGNICSCARGDRKTAGGFRWEYTKKGKKKC